MDNNEMQAAPKVEVRKMVQVFLAGEGSGHAEISEELAAPLEFRTPWIVVRTKDFAGEQTDHYFPVGQVRMIRVFDEKEEA